MSTGPETRPPSAAGRLMDWLERRLNVTEIFSFLTHFGLVYTPVDTSRPMREVWRDVESRTVSSYMRWPQSLGVIIAVLFAFEALTGVLLACYYQPSPEAAFPSTRMIARDLPFGWLLHQTHAWGAYLLILALAVRVIRMFWDGFYRAPREVLWVSAVSLAWIAVQADFTGRLLPWDSQSYWSVVRGLEQIHSQPVVGPVLAFMVGGRTVTEDMLIRFYVLHVMVLPALFLGFFYLTFATLRRVGLSGAAQEPAGGPRTTTFRDHLFSLVTLCVIVVGVLVSMAVLLPLPFRGQADPYTTPVGARPPWYLLPPYTLTEGLSLPHWLTGVGLLLASLAVLLMPVLARRWDRPEHEKRLRLGSAAVFAIWVLLGIAGLFLSGAK